jgi:hypothetical protein
MTTTKGELTRLTFVQLPVATQTITLNEIRNNAAKHYRRKVDEGCGVPVLGEVVDA